jgi:threonine/homoserine/homoserine lactone efflux protein
MGDIKIYSEEEPQSLNNKQVFINPYKLGIILVLLLLICLLFFGETIITQNKTILAVLTLASSLLLSYFTYSISPKKGGQHNEQNTKQQKEIRNNRSFKNIWKDIKI